MTRCCTGEGAKRAHGLQRLPEEFDGSKGTYPYIYIYMYISGKPAFYLAPETLLGHMSHQPMNFSCWQFGQFPHVRHGLEPYGAAMDLVLLAWLGFSI